MKHKKCGKRLIAMFLALMMVLATPAVALADEAPASSGSSTQIESVENSVEEPVTETKEEETAEKEATVPGTEAGDADKVKDAQAPEGENAEVPENAKTPESTQTADDEKLPDDTETADDEKLPDDTETADDEKLPDDTATADDEKTLDKADESDETEQAGAEENMDSKVESLLLKSEQISGVVSSPRRSAARAAGVTVEKYANYPTSAYIYEYGSPSYDYSKQSASETVLGGQTSTWHALPLYIVGSSYYKPDIYYYQIRSTVDPDGILAEETPTVRAATYPEGNFVGDPCAQMNIQTKEDGSGTATVKIRLIYHYNLPVSYSKYAWQYIDYTFTVTSIPSEWSQGHELYVPVNYSGEIQFNAFVDDEQQNISDLSVRSGDSSIASISGSISGGTDANIKIEGLTVGETTVYASYKYENNGYSISKTEEITVHVYSPHEMELNKGEETDFVHALSFEDNAIDAMDISFDDDGGEPKVIAGEDNIAISKYPGATKWNISVKDQGVDTGAVAIHIEGKEVGNAIIKSTFGFFEEDGSLHMFVDVINVTVKDTENDTKKAITSFTKSLVKNAENYDGTVSGITYPGNDKVVIPTDGSVKLLYRLTVTGEEGANFVIEDQDAVLVEGQNGVAQDPQTGKITGTIPEGGTIDIYVTKTFDANDISQDGKLTNTASVQAGDNTEVTGSGSDEAAIPAEKKEEPVTPPTISEETVKSLLKNAVRIKCENTTAQHEDGIYGLLDGGYTIGEVIGDADTGYTVDITVTPNRYVEQYNTDRAVEHKLDSDTQGEKTITLEYDDETDGWKVFTSVPVEYTVICETETSDLTVDITEINIDSSRPYFLKDTFTVTAKASDDEAVVNMTCESDAVQLKDRKQNSDGTWTFTYEVVKITGKYSTLNFTATASKAENEAVDNDFKGINLRNRIHVVLKESDDTIITDASVMLNHKYPQWNRSIELSYDENTRKYQNSPWDVANEAYTNIIVTLPDGRTATIMENTAGKSLEKVITAGTEEVSVEYKFPAYTVIGKLYVNGKPVYKADGTSHYTNAVSGVYGTEIDYENMKEWAIEQTKEIEGENAPIDFQVKVYKDGGKYEPETTYGEMGKLTNYVWVDVTTYYGVTFDAGNGETPVVSQVKYGEKVEQPEDPEKADYVFGGWYLGDEKYDFDSPVTSSITLTAKWTAKETVQIVIYRNGNTTTPYATVSLPKMSKGETLKVSELNIADYYKGADFEFEGWYNDGGWNNYKSGNKGNKLGDSIVVNGWTNIICMVTDYEKVVVKAVTDGDKDGAETIFTGKALRGENLIEYLEAQDLNLDKPGYTLDKWFNWDWYGHKFNDDKTVNGWTNVYVTYTANAYTIVYHGNGGQLTSNPAKDQTTSNCKYDQEVTLKNASTFTRDGWAFLGWSTTADGKAEYAGSAKGVFNFTAEADGQFHLYAVWTPYQTPLDPVSVAYRVEHYKEQLDGTYKLEEAEFPLYVEVDSEDGILVEATAKAYEHYTENLSHSDRVASGIVKRPVWNGDQVEWEMVTLKLYYDLDEFEITFEAGEHGTFADNAAKESGTYKYGAAYPEAPAVTAGTGYVFAGWYVDDVKAEGFPGTVTGSAVYIAKYKADTNNNGIADDEETKYTVTYTDGVDGEEIFKDQVYTDLLSGTATPAFVGTPERSGYQFKGWSPALSEKVNGTVVYRATWEKSSSSSNNSSSGKKKHHSSKDSEDTDTGSAAAQQGQPSAITSPKTGDVSPIIPMLALALASVMGIGAVLLDRKKKGCQRTDRN